LFLILGCVGEGKDVHTPTAGDTSGPTETGAPDSETAPDSDTASPDSGDTTEVTDCPEVTPNAVMVAGVPVRLYATPDGGGATFSLVDGVVSSTDADGTERWSVDTDGVALFGGFDVDADGWTDAAVVTSTVLGTLCGTTDMVETGLTFVSGADGTLISGVSPLPDLCWDFSGTVYPTSQWTVDGVSFGTEPGLIALAPYYATNAWFFTWGGTSFSSEYAYYPSTSSYDDAYTADQPNAWGTGTSYLANSHVANGLLLETGGELRWVFFTSGRVVHYAVEPWSAAQLRLDVPYLSAGRTDLAGRNYGLVTRDPGDPDHLALLTGVDAAVLLADAVAGAAVTDPWGAIERHVTVHDLATGAVDDRFFSYAHDDSDGWQYRERVAYPAGAWVRGDGASALAFSVYDGTTWAIHVTTPGGTADASVEAGAYLWDIRDLDDDGTDEWIVSPTAGYLPDWTTEVRAADGSVRATFIGLPALVAGFREAAVTSSRGYLYPALVVDGSCGPGLALLQEDGSYTVGEL
jgi:hypothetical protein